MQPLEVSASGQRDPSPILIIIGILLLLIGAVAAFLGIPLLLTRITIARSKMSFVGRQSERPSGEAS